MNLERIAKKYDGRYVILSMKPQYAGVGRKKDFKVLRVCDGVLEALTMAEYYKSEGFSGVFIYPCAAGELPLLPKDTARMFRVLYGLE